MLVVVDAFPGIALMGMLFVICIMMWLATFFMKKRENNKLRIVGTLIAVVYILIFGMGTYYLTTTYSVLSKISLNETSSVVKPNRVDVMEEAFNVYITGIDQWDKEKGYDLERSDVNMILTVCPNTRTVLLTSIPRDTYVPLHRTGTMDKLTHTGIYGVDETLNTVYDWLGIDLNYYVKMNFSAVVSIINAMDGVDVYSDREFKPVKRPWWTVKKGWNHMNGKEALAFARERRAYDEDDSKRVVNQQKVIRAMFNKLLSSSTLLTRYGEIVSVAGNSLETNMPMEDIKKLAKMQMLDLGEWNIETQKLKGEYDMDYVASMAQTSKYQVYKISNTSIREIKKRICKTMNPDAKEVAKTTAEREKNSIIAFFVGIFSR